ncbi:MAG: hypothetical protein HYZ87_04850 [Candidatus Omnitrophica bacterium]|nr:hypothetical protein [Candidatus Omnitrophota bacterium]
MKLGPKRLLFQAVLLFFAWSGAGLAQEATPRVIPEDALRRFEADIVRRKAEQASSREKKEALPGGLVKMSGRYRLAAGAGRDLILNDSNSYFNLYNLQGPNSEYLYGERLFNTFDRAIYDQLLFNIDFSPAEKVNFFTQIVNDPWSWVGTTGEQVQQSDTDRTVVMRYNLKYFGANNSTIGESYRNNIADLYNFPIMKVHGGRVNSTRVEGLDDFDGAPGNKHGIPFTIADQGIDYEYKPVRKLWMDTAGDGWNARVFALADETQALTTDDPLELSNHKDYWEASPWLYEYKPLQHFTDGSVKRGFYSDNLAFKARDSEGNRLVLLRGVSLNLNRDKTSVAATVASPYTPWDESYFENNNIPGAMRVKHQASERLKVGGTYTFRSGLIDHGLADFNQTAALDTEYQWKENTVLKKEVAISSREWDMKAGDGIHTNRQGFAAKAVMETHKESPNSDRTDLEISAAFMDRNFTPPLSRRLNTRDDRFWGLHLSFDERPDVEPFKLGDGLDTNRIVLRLNWKERRLQKRLLNLLDARNVHRARNTAYLETVVRDEVTYQFNSRLTGKALVRWRGLPRTTPNVDPVLTGYYFSFDNIDTTNFYIRNTDIQADKNADQWTFSAGLQYWLNDQWALEGTGERTNVIPDFPRGILNDFFRDSNERVEGILEDRMINFLYGQKALKAVAPYPFYNVVRERVIYKPSEKMRVTFHAAQNGYHFASGIDDNTNHQGVSVGYDYSNKLVFFADYTHSKQISIPTLVATDYAKEEDEDHHNVYVSADYRINANTVFRAEYGVFGLGSNSALASPYSVTSFSLPTLDTEHLLRVSLNGDF